MRFILDVAVNTEEELIDVLYSVMEDIGFSGLPRCGVKQSIHKPDAGNDVCGTYSLFPAKESTT